MTDTTTGIAIKHGEYAGYRAHRNHNIPIPTDDSCGCRAARNQWERDRRAARATARDNAHLTDKERANLAAIVDSPSRTARRALIFDVVEAIIANRLLAQQPQQQS